MTDIAIVDLITQFGSIGIAGWLLWWATKIVIPRIQDQLEAALSQARDERREFHAVLQEITQSHRMAEERFAEGLSHVAIALEELRKQIKQSREATS